MARRTMALTQTQPTKKSPRKKKTHAKGPVNVMLPAAKTAPPAVTWPARPWPAPCSWSEWLATAWPDVLITWFPEDEEHMAHCRFSAAIHDNPRFQGLVAPEAWGDDSHEISLNLNQIVALTPEQIIAFLVHEGCHLVIHHRIKTGRYAETPRMHGREWSAEMVLRGLMPSTTGAPGGRVTGGEIMSHYIPEDMSFANKAASILRRLPACPNLWPTATETAAASVPLKRVGRIYDLVVDYCDLKERIDLAVESGLAAIDTETTSTDPLTCKLVGFSVAHELGGSSFAWYCPVGHTGPGSEDQLPLDPALEQFRRLCEDKAVVKVLHNAAYDLTVLDRYEIEVENFEDTQLRAYVLKPDNWGFGMDPLAAKHLSYEPIHFDEVRIEGMHATFAEVDTWDAAQYAAEDTDVTLQLYHEMRLTPQAERLYREIDLPLIAPIRAMEKRGVLVDAAKLSALADLWGPEREQLEKHFAGLDLNSPAAVGRLLYEDLKLPCIVRTKTGSPATDADTLKAMEKFHPAVAAILRYRELTKLLDTFVVGLARNLHEDGRLRADIRQTSTRTGRLSATDGLNQIPTRTADGAKLRECFIAPPGYKLISADYSQIELRILAHVCGEPVFVNAFMKGLDVHAATAEEVFAVKQADVDPAAFKTMRASAKTVNFGLLYGQTAYGLARGLNRTEDEAQAFINDYFAKLPGLDAWMKREKALARQRGHTLSLMGRKYAYPELRSSKEWQRNAAERQAINAIIQGSAADLFRTAIRKVWDQLQRRPKLDTHLLAPVHDELLIEAREDRVEEALVLVRRMMETALDHVIQWHVPILADAKAGLSWADCK